MIPKSTFRTISLILVLFGLVPAVYAQDGKIESSSDATTHLNSKNMSVDPATGIFNYSIPIHQIKVGNFIMPISFDYSARGVKADDQRGILDYNWNLSVGGVVTRTLRGGIADEILNKGAAYLYFGNDDVPIFPAVCQSTADNREHDGESDIFTAVFNGRAISFFIRGNYNRFLEVIPLEPTEVKIFWSNPGWHIIDEEGTEYFFTKEERSYTSREGNVSINKLDVDHISAWYLETVRPINMPPIEYEYVGNGAFSGYHADSMIKKSYRTRTTLDYMYGKPLIDRPYDFSKYANEFERAIENAVTQLNSVDNTQFYGRAEQFIFDEKQFSIPTYNFNPSVVLNRLKSFGLLDTDRIDVVYDQMIMMIENYIQLALNISKPAAIPHLIKAKDLLIECMNETKTTYSKYVYQYGMQEIVSPMLKRIKYNDRIIEFSYNRFFSPQYLLTAVDILDTDRQLISSVKINRHTPYSEQLDQVTMMDKSGNTVQSISFEYYPLFDYPTIINIHGEHVKYPGPDPELDTNYVNEHRFWTHSDPNAFYRSLKTIKVGTETQIDLTYLNNFGEIPTNNGSPISPGGISIRCITMRDNYTNKIDEIFYNYFPNFLHPVYSNLSNVQFVEYENFTDVIRYDRLIPEGPGAIIKTGNNGYYYQQVIECFNGQGTTIYEFTMPDLSGIYNYWEIGNPISQEFRDKNDRLKKRIVYVYDDQIGLPYKKFRNQYMAGEYQMDNSEMNERYKNTEYYQDNIACRLNPFLNTGTSYQIAYNYKTYLTRIEEYDYESEEQGSSTITEFTYDLPKSTMPVRTIVTHSDGTKQIQSVRRALDFDNSADLTIGLLKYMNIVGPPVQTRVEVEDHAGVRHLVSEKVNRFTDFGQPFTPEVKLTEVLTYAHDGLSVPNNSSLLSFNRSKYDITTLGYTTGEGTQSALPLTEENQRGRMEKIYDPCNMNLIFSAVNNPAKSVAACDWKRFKAPNSSTGKPTFKLLNAPSLKYRLYVIANLSVSQQLTLSINGTSPRNFTLSTGKSGPQVFDLDLTGVTNIQQISLTSSDQNIIYLALAPSDCEFEAQSYNSDGTVFCKFNQNGQMERYEYDGAGRVVKVFDNKGNLLRENKYNVVLP